MALMEGNQSLLKFRMCGCGFTYGLRACETHERQCNAKRSGCNQGNQQCQACSCDSMCGKREVIEQQHQCDRDNECSAGKDGRAAQPCSQLQPVLQPRDIGIELLLPAHASSRCVPM